MSYSLMTARAHKAPLFETLKPEPGELNGCKIVIIDGHALAYRSYYAIRTLSNSKGQATNAVYGFIRTLL
ncbi:MAG: hypothetical protein M3511_00110, partial [Deinococcota bacterium]|nr:hypothetical protein [Deinococcota bacterium]